MVIVQSAVVNNVTVFVVLDSVMAAVVQLGCVRASVERAVVRAVSRAVAVMTVGIVVVPVPSVRTVRRMVVRVVVLMPVMRVGTTMSTVWMVRGVIAMAVVPSVTMPVSVMVSVMTMSLMMASVRSVSAMTVIRRTTVVPVRVVLIQHRVIFCEKQTRRRAFVLAAFPGSRRAHGSVLAGLAVVLTAGLALFVGGHAAFGHGLLLLNDDLLGPLGHPLEVLAVVFLALEADIPAIPHDQ